MITYSEYAPTNIVWDKTMPSHWKCDKAKRFFSNPKELNRKFRKECSFTDSAGRD